MMLKNATYLFGQAQNGFHHSQSRWSAIAQMAMLHLSHTGQSTLNVYRSRLSRDRNRWIVKSDQQLPLAGWNASNTVVEGNIKYLFGDEALLETEVYPDIVYKNEQTKAILLIVVRTTGRTVRGRKKDGRDNIDRYEALAETIRVRGWQCELYYLMSYGHEDEGNQCEGSPDEAKRHLDWKRLESVNANILFWEELFTMIQKSTLARYIAGDLEKYTLQPHWISS